MIKIDLHTHSIISPDGGISEFEYTKILEKKILDYIAITDHNETKFAQKLKERLGKQIIVGEEITTTDGEMIGLFLKTTISAGLSALETAKKIHEQGGLVYIPHPFETIRQGIQKDVLEAMTDHIDIMEIFNGRGKWRGKAKEAEIFSQQFHVSPAASSDAHGYKGVGKTFSLIGEIPTKQNLVQLLHRGKPEKVYAPWISFFYPSINTIKKKL